MGKRDVRREMEAVLKRWQSSGKSLRAFGRDTGVSYNRLIYWKRRLIDGKKSKSERSPAQRLIPVTIVDEPRRVAGDAPDFVLEVGDDHRLRIPSAFETDSLRRLLAVITRC